MVRSITFTLPFALNSLNVRQRQHWAELHRAQRMMSQEVMAAIKGPRHYPRPPYEACSVTVVRSSVGALDDDNLWASCKPLLDALCVASLRHPAGLGIIVDDSPDRLSLTVRQADAAPGDGATTVLVEEVEYVPPAPRARRARKAAAPR